MFPKVDPTIPTIIINKGEEIPATINGFCGHRSSYITCIKSSIEAALCAFPTSYLFSGYFPTKQLEHIPSEVCMRGKNSTILSLYS